MDGKKVQCSKCGYLAVRNLRSQELVSPAKPQRASGLPPAGDGPKTNLSVEPICAMAVFDLEAEVTGQGPAPAAKVMKAERECGEFTPWVPLLSTPKEHLDMNLIREQREWQAAQAQLADDRYRRTSNREIFVAVATVAATLLAVLLGSWLNSGSNDRPPEPAAQTSSK